MLLSSIAEIKHIIHLFIIISRTNATARNGRAVAWVLLESCEKALYVDTLEELSEEEISDQLC